MATDAATRRFARGNGILLLRSRAALVALFFVLAHFGGLSHFAAVRHEVCDEHGRLEHGSGEDAGHAEADTARAAPRFDAAPHARSNGHHDTCHLSFLTGASSYTRAAEPSRAVDTLAPVRESVDRTPRSYGSIPVLRLAPKHSPPAVA